MKSFFGATERHSLFWALSAIIDLSGKMLSALQGNIYLGSLGFLGGFLNNFGGTPQEALQHKCCVAQLTKLGLATVHEVLQKFFTEQRAQGKAWYESDYGIKTAMFYHILPTFDMVLLRKAHELGSVLS